LSGLQRAPHVPGGPPALAAWVPGRPAAGLASAQASGGSGPRTAPRATAMELPVSAVFIPPSSGAAARVGVITTARDAARAARSSSPHVVRCAHVCGVHAPRHESGHGPPPAAMATSARQVPAVRTSLTARGQDHSAAAAGATTALASRGDESEISSPQGHGIWLNGGRNAPATRHSPPPHGMATQIVPAAVSRARSRRRLSAPLA